MIMAREYLPKLTIALFAVSIALILLSGQLNPAAATPTSPQWGWHYPTYYSSSYSCWSHHWYYYYGYCSYYYNYGYPYYYYYYPYSYGSYIYPYYGYYSSYYATPYSYSLTVTTDPSSLGTVTGSGTYTQGSSASFSITQNTVQVSPTSRYVFSHWSGDFSGAGASGTVTVNGAMTITAVYQQQYYLSLTVQPQSAPTPQGEGWYNAGNSVTLQNAGQTIGGEGGSRLLFQGWSVDGQSAQPGSSLDVTMDAPHNVTALYTQQYYLNVQTDQGVAYGSGWYDSGSTAQIYASTPISTTYGVNIVFNGWQGDIQSNNQSTTVPMNGPKEVIATWRTDSTVLYLTIAAAIIAALLIVGAIVALLVRGRGSSMQPPPTPPSPVQKTMTDTGPHDDSAAAKKTIHHRKKPTPEPTPEGTETPASTETPSEHTA
jgi:hypothetical protein